MTVAETVGEKQQHTEMKMMCVDLFSMIKAIAKRMEFNDVVDIALRVSALNHSCILNESAVATVTSSSFSYFSCL